MKKQLILLLTATLNLAVCGENKPADSGEKAVTTQSKPVETTDERCQEDGEKNAEQDGKDTVDCVVVDSKKPDSPPNKPDELKGQALLQKYAPKACYKSVSSTTTSTGKYANGVNESYANLDLKAHMSITKAARGCVIKMWQYADRQGYMWFSAACSPANVPDSKPMPPDPFFRSKFYCPGTLNGYHNVKMTKLGGKEVIYAESSQGEARIENWFNLKPFYITKSISHSPGNPAVTMHHTVQINENINSEIFAMPKK